MTLFAFPRFQANNHWLRTTFVRGVFALLSIYLLSPYNMAHAQVFVTDMVHSEWMAASDPVCSLSHPIAGFGKAVFVHNPAGAATFYIEQQSKIVFPLSTVTIETLPPAWRSNVIPVRLGTIASMQGSKPIVLDVVQLRLLLEQLAKGNNIVFSPQIPVKDKPSSAGVSVSSGANVMRLVLEAKNFAAAYRHFQTCAGDVMNDISGEQKEVGANYSESLEAKNPTLSPSSLSSGAQVFAADIKDVQWNLTTTPFVCTLAHSIPHFGTAVLSRKANASDMFYLEVKDSIIFPLGEGSFETAPPVWRGDQVPLTLGRLNSVVGKRPITLMADSLTILLAQLTAGTNVVFVGKNTAHTNVMRVIVDAKFFAREYKGYQQCVNDLMPYTFAQLSRSLFNYPENATELDGSVKTELAKISRYVKVDPKVLRILVDVHTDSSGSPEERDVITKNHAEWVSAYLVEKGIPAAKIVTRWHADKFPVADNKTPSGKAKNRRITVRLEDESTQREAEQKAAEYKLLVEKKLKERAEKEAAAESAVKEEAKQQLVKESIATTPANQALQSANSSIQGKVTPEQINKMVEGLDLINKKP